MPKKIVELIDATFSDSFYETYGFVSKDMLLSSFKAASKANIKYMEIGGNISFLSSIYHLQEAAFSDFNEIRKHIAEDINLQVASYSMGGFSSEFLDYELLKKFAGILSRHQITTVRTYDPLNSLENIDFSAQLYEQNGLLNDITLLIPNGSYDMSSYIAFLEQLKYSYLFFNSLSIIDLFGTASSTFIYELVTIAKEILGEHSFVSLGIKNSTSTALLAYVAAIDAGVDGLYLSNNIADYAYSYPDMLTLMNVGKDLNFIFNQVEKKDIIEYKNTLKRVVEKIPTKNKQAPTSEAFEYLVPLDEREFFKNRILNSNDEELIRKRALIFKEFNEIVEALNLKSISKPFSNNIFNQAINNIKYGAWEKIDESFMKNIIHNSALFEIQSPKLQAIVQKYKDFDFYTNSYEEAIDKLLQNKNMVICDETIIIATISEVLEEKVNIFNEIKEESFHIELGSKEYLVKIKEGSEELEILKQSQQSDYTLLLKTEQKALIKEIRVLIGEEVVEGQVLMILEVGDKEIEVVAKIDGFVENIYVQEGDELKANEKLLLLAV